MIQTSLFLNPHIAVISICRVRSVKIGYYFVVLHNNLQKMTNDHIIEEYNPKS